MSGVEFMFYTYLAALIGMVWGLHLTACYESDRHIYSLYGKDYRMAWGSMSSIKEVIASENLYLASRHGVAKLAK